MKIASASMSLQSQHFAASREEVQQRLRVWVGEPPPNGAAGSTVALSAAARTALAVDAQGTPAAAIDQAFEAANHDPFLQLLKTMIELMTGEPVRVFSAADLGPAPPAVAQPARAAGTAATPPPRAGYGVEYDYHAVREEVEQTHFAAQGVIRTADGQQIAFTLDLQMSRQYREERSVSLRAGDAVRKDPLVLNFGGTAVQLSAQRFAFDLLGSGRAGERLPMLAAGSGYLAFDRNGNGRIDSGLELFGPASNSGFGELAAFDADGNGWIDESDPSFAQLQLWTPDAAGQGELRSLQDAGVGALALAHVATPFELRGPGNSPQGNVAATGVFLRNDKGIGTVQEIDLVT